MKENKIDPNELFPEHDDSEPKERKNPSFSDPTPQEFWITAGFLAFKATHKDVTAAVLKDFFNVKLKAFEAHFDKIILEIKEEARESFLKEISISIPGAPHGDLSDIYLRFLKFVIHPGYITHQQLKNSDFKNLNINSIDEKEFKLYSKYEEKAFSEGIAHLLREYIPGKINVLKKDRYNKQVQMAYSKEPKKEISGTKNGPELEEKQKLLWEYLIEKCYIANIEFQIFKSHLEGFNNLKDYIRWKKHLYILLYLFKELHRIKLLPHAFTDYDGSIRDSLLINHFYDKKGNKIDLGTLYSVKSDKKDCAPDNKKPLQPIALIISTLEGMA